MIYSREAIDLALYRIEKARKDLHDAQRTLVLDMFSTAANRSYYAIFHSARAVLALDGKDYKKHTGVISNFQKDYIKTGIFEKGMSSIIKAAFDMRTESDYEDFYVVPTEDIQRQVAEAAVFVQTVEVYLKERIAEISEEQ